MQEERVKYEVMGTEGFYTFEDQRAGLHRKLGELQELGFIIIGIDGVNGFKAREVTHG